MGTAGIGDFTPSTLGSRVRPTATRVRFDKSSAPNGYIGEKSVEPKDAEGGWRMEIGPDPGWVLVWDLGLHQQCEPEQ
ncbi:MAG: hypothetical protein CVT59_05620 [Actinobacteria bacterium HGW-Actinobacteria-1]|nr:MAG: hypothetical protein CVT59_05620 [Actinobacteria bacterium HGW-Actinobacteria-1]